MTIEKPTWAVVATVDEAPALVQAFVAWYLHLGASEVFVFFDRPDDPALAEIQHLPQVRAQTCDARYWAKRKSGRPHRHEARQAHNATRAHRKMRSDWLLHADADEFLWGAEDVHTYLAGCAAATDGLVVPVAERFLTPHSAQDTIFSGGFRRPGPNEHCATLRGLTGHVMGKAFARKDRPLNMSIHRPKLRKPDAGNPLILERAMGLDVLHFDGLTALHWICKLLCRADAFAHRDGMPPRNHRQAQMDIVGQGPAGVFDVHNDIKVLSDAQVRGLRDQDLWLDAGFDPRPALAAVFPEVPVDVSPDRMNGWLWQRYGPLLAAFGLVQ